MNIIINHTLRSIQAHKAQTAVIVLTVTIVTMLFFVALSIGDLFYNMQLGAQKRTAGDSDVKIQGDIFSGALFDEFVEEKKDWIEYSSVLLEFTGIARNDEESSGESVLFTIDATDLDFFCQKRKNDLKVFKKADDDFRGAYPDIMIGKALYDERGYDIGQDITVFLSFYGRYEKFTITYIFENEGFFGNSSLHNVLIDIGRAGDLGFYNTGYIKLKDGVNKESFKQSMVDFFGNPNLKVGDAIDYEHIENVVRDNKNLLSVGLIFIVSIVLFILYGAYLVLAKNRTGEMLVFKASGATPKQMLLILLAEGVVYGIIGGIFGTVCARLAMQIAVIKTIPLYADSVQYSFVNYFVSLVLGTVISVVGEAIPAFKLVRNSVKKANSSGKKINPLFGLIPMLAIIASIVCIVVFKILTYFFTVLLIISAVAMIIIYARFILRFVFFPFGKTKGMSLLSSMTVKNNSDAISISCLIGAVIAFTFIAISIVNVVIGAVTPYNSRFKSDYVVQSYLSGSDMNEQKKIISDTFGVSECCLLFYDEFDATLSGRKTNLMVYATDNADSLSCAVSLTDKEKERFNNIDNAAVFSYDMLNRLQLKIGDSVKMSLNGKEYVFNIIAVDNTITGTDRVIYTNKKGCDYNFTKSMIMIKASKNVSSKDLFYDLKEKTEANGCFIIDFNEWAYGSTKGMNGVTTILRFLQIIIGLVCAVGIINLTISMMMGREKEFIVYKSVGMDRRKYYKLLICESLGISVSGSLIGLFLSMLMNFLMPTFAELIDRHISLTIPFEALIPVAIGIVLFGTIYCAIGSRFGKGANEIRDNQKL